MKDVSSTLTKIIIGSIIVFVIIAGFLVVIFS